MVSVGLTSCLGRPRDRWNRYRCDSRSGPQQSPGSPIEATAPFSWRDPRIAARPGPIRMNHEILRFCTACPFVTYQWARPFLRQSLTIGHLTVPITRVCPVPHGYRFMSIVFECIVRIAMACSSHSTATCGMASVHLRRNSCSRRATRALKPRPCGEKLVELNPTNRLGST